MTYFFSAFSGVDLFLRTRLRKNTILQRKCSTVGRGSRPIALCRVLFLLACCLLPASVTAADLAITSATVHVGNGEVIQDGTVLVSGGRITAVGGKGDVKIPVGAQRVDARGLHLIPGMIDLRSLELVPESNSPFGINSRIAVIDGLDPFERWGLSLIHI